MTQTLAEIAAQLEEPFAIGDIDLLPKGKTERDGKTLCMALPYADVRVYEDRLNKLAPGEWSTPPPMALVVGQKLVVYVTVVVCGVVHTDVGEAAAGGENAATESWAQAFKRACSQFGLGRYLYDLDKAWVPYDVQRKQIRLSTTEIQSVVRKMYIDARITAEPVTNGTVSIVAPRSPAARPEPPVSRPTAESMNIANDVMTADQLHAIENMYKQLGKAVPPDVRTLSRLKAEDTIRNLTTDMNLARQKKEVNREKVGAK